MKPHAKWPRQYAAEIIQLPKAADRAAALKRVPEHLQLLVRALVTCAFERKKMAKRGKRR